MDEKIYKFSKMSVSNFIPEDIARLVAAQTANLSAEIAKINKPS